MTTKCVAIIHCPQNHKAKKTFFYSIILPTFLNDTRPSSVLPKSISGNTCNIKVEDASVDSPPSVAQADVEVVDVQVVGTQQAIEERLPHKCKSNYGDGNQKKQWKHASILDTNLAKQVNQVSPENIVDSSLQATQAEDVLVNKDGANGEMTHQETKYFTIPVTCNKNFAWWEGFELFNPQKHPTLYKDNVMC
jgi:hypothetical protein